MKIIADSKIPFLQGVFEPYATVIYIDGDKISKSDIIDADALIIRTRTKCNKDLLEGTNIKIVFTATIGYDHIDTKWCEQNGIIWKNAEGCNSGSVKQYITSALVWLAEKHNFGFEEKTIGIIGVGHIGKRIMKVAEAFDMRVVLNDPPLARNTKQCGLISLEGILREADIISLHVPLINEGIDKTSNLFSKEIIEKTLKGTILINSSRGEVVNETDVKNYLQSGHLKAYIADVWHNEPDIDKALMNMADLSTSHIAGYSIDGKANGTAQAVQAISKYFRLPLNDWYPSNLPEPENGLILEIDCLGKTVEDVLSKVILKTYNIYTDSQKLKTSPNNFELNRENYQIRREFSAYSLKLYNSNKEISDKLHWLGFKIIH